MVFVIFTSHQQSFRSSNTSAVQKNLPPFCAGLPSGLSGREETSAGISCGWQLSTHPACSEVKRAAVALKATETDADLLSCHTSRPTQPKANSATDSIGLTTENELL